MAEIVKSAERTLRVFEYFARVRRPATASEIENALDLPQSSTSVLLRSLVDLGYLDFAAGERAYHPSMRLAVLGEWLKADVSIGFLTSRLEKLREQTRETIMIGCRQGHQIHYIQILLSSQEIQFFLPQGTRHPLCLSASGRALLSSLSNDEIAKIVRRNNFEATNKRQRVEEAIVLASVEQFRQTGISETDPALGGPKEYHAISTLVPSSISDEPHSIGVVGPRARILRQRARIVDALKGDMGV